ncbi:MAG: BrnT family toxin [Treponema sp.]|nr:BrnT family toxin [Treponema sp.]
MEYRFEWDEKKNTTNKEKHGVSFDEALLIFNDPNRFEFFDKKHSFFEDRWTAVGLNSTTVLRVCFTEKNGSIRIISVRKADKKEEEKYFYGYSTKNN